MNKINISELREFLKRSGKIKTNGILPIHDFILVEFELETTNLIKTNGKVYCKHRIEEGTDTPARVLIEEKKLAALVSNSKGGEFITVKVKGEQVILQDQASKITVAFEDAKHFPEFPENGEGERVGLSGEVLAALFEASKFTLLGDTNFSNVYIQKHGTQYCVISSNRGILYRRAFDYALPQLALNPEACNMISGFNMVEYYTQGNYNFFDTGKTIFGFVVSEFSAPDLVPVFTQLKMENEFTISKESVTSFCDLVNSSATLKFPDVVVEPGKDNVLSFSYNEAHTNMDVQKNIEAKSNFEVERFKCSANNLSNIIGCFSTDEVVFHPSHKGNVYGFDHADEPGLLVALGLLMN